MCDTFVFHPLDNTYTSVTNEWPFFLMANNFSSIGCFVHCSDDSDAETVDGDGRYLPSCTYLHVLRLKFITPLHLIGLKYLFKFKI